jgi:tetratricopeptide (TPR) repeat protein
MSHYDDEALLMYAEGTSPIREEITAHVTACGACAGLLSAHEELAAMLRMADVWTDAWEEKKPATPADHRRVQDLAAVAQRLDDEQSSAAAIVETLLASPQPWWRTKLLREGGQTVGVIRALLDRARAIQPKAPLQALEITSLAVDVAAELPIVGYPSDLIFSIRGHAWREHAYTLSLLGRYREALDATARAEEVFRQTALPEYELARIDLMRVHVFRAIDRVPEAIMLARKAAATFEEFGDRRRFLNAQVTTAAMLYSNGTIRDALEIWHAVVDDRDLDDVTRIMVMANLGLCYRELGDFDRACQQLSTAIAEYEVLGMDMYKTRTRNSLATTLMRAGRSDAAIRMFEDSWKEFERLGMESEAALVALELAEALLVVGRPERVPHICRTLLDRFTSAGMTSRAVTALAFLREAVAAGQAQPTLVRHVYDFLRAIPATSGGTTAMAMLPLED